MSATLRRLAAESDKRHQDLIDKGYAGNGSPVNPKTFEPCEEYPAPWRYTRSVEGICDIWSGSNRIAGWINERDAKAIIEEISYRGVQI